MTHGRRRPIVAGNWKMNGTQEQAVTITRDLLKGFHATPQIEVVLCPPFTVLQKVGELLRASSISLGAQNIHWEAKAQKAQELNQFFLFWQTQQAFRFQSVLSPHLCQG
jgi:triosephosphate isomerase